MIFGRKSIQDMEYKGPFVGDRRVKVKFALIPRFAEFEDGTFGWIWLQKVKVTQRYTIWPDWDNPQYRWETTKVEPYNG